MIGSSFYIFVWGHCKTLRLKNRLYSLKIRVIANLQSFYYGVIKKRAVLHYLHIGKTGGSAIKKAFNNRSVVEVGEYVIIFHPHAIKSYHVPKRDRVIFGIRNPIKRFVSGFESRLRKGKPKYNIDWSKRERSAFERFPSAVHLAYALKENEDETAKEAMNDIAHVKDCFSDWVGSVIRSGKSERIFHVFVLENLEESFEGFSKKIKTNEFRLPVSKKESHKSGRSEYEIYRYPELVDLIKRHYEDDFLLIDELYKLGIISEKDIGEMM